MADDLIGKTINGYAIEEVVGKGGMATVYRAHQVSMNRSVAVKVLPEQYINDDTYLQRFNQEVAIVSKLEHRNIVPVHDYGQYNGRPYIVMRLMNGGSIDDLLAKGALEPEVALNIIEQIAPALDFAHSKNVLHRDLKPSNVLLDDDGGAYLTDFGIARVLGEQATSGITTQGVVGTPSYMSPEQAQGLTLDGRSDIYGLGVMLYEMLTGKRPFHADTPYGIAVMQVTTPPPQPRLFNPNLSLSVEEMILKALRKKPEERFQTAVALSDGLKKALNRPLSTLHDTQPNAQLRQNTQPVMSQPQPVVQPQPVYNVPQAAPMTPAPVSTNYLGGYVRRRKQKSNNIWLSAAIGGVIGCGLLAVLVVIVVIVVNFLTSGGAGVSIQPTAIENNPTAPVNDSQNVIPTLDPTSEAGRATLVPNGSVLPTLATTPTLIPVGVREAEAVNPIAQDIGGVMIFFARRNNNYDLYRMDMATGNQTQLTSDGGNDTYLSVAPDGQSLVFQSNRDGDFDLYILNLVTGDLRQLTNNGVLDRSPSWSPDGEWIAFSSDTDENRNMRLYRIRPDGSGLEELVNNGQLNTEPRYSPDGQYLVFTTGKADDQDTHEIAEFSFETGEVTRLTNNQARDWLPTYSPDGDQIIYSTSLNGDQEANGRAALAIMSHDGSDIRILYDGLAWEQNPQFSPDGRWITFNAVSPFSEQQEVFMMSPDGSDVVQLTNGGGEGAIWIR